MALSAGDRKALLKQWIRPSSDDEQDQQARAERMVREAIKAHGAFKGAKVSIYSKGSYPNNTNVRRDSDVDIAVELQDCIYYDYLAVSVPRLRPSPARTAAPGLPRHGEHR